MATARKYISKVSAALSLILQARSAVLPCFPYTARNSAYREQKGEQYSRKKQNSFDSGWGGIAIYWIWREETQFSILQHYQLHG